MYINQAYQQIQVTLAKAVADNIMKAAKRITSRMELRRTRGGSRLQSHLGAAIRAQRFDDLL